MISLAHNLARRIGLPVKLGHCNAIHKLNWVKLPRFIKLEAKPSLNLFTF